MGKPSPGWGRMAWAAEAFRRCEWIASRNLALGLATQADGSLGLSVHPDRVRSLGARLGLTAEETADGFQELVDGGWLLVDIDKHTARLNVPDKNRKMA